MLPFSYGGLFIPASTEADGNIKSLFIFYILGVLSYHIQELNMSFQAL